MEKHKRLLDLFCGAGGAAMGYYRADFTDITGIDNRPMPRYPFKFIQADALEFLKEHGHEFDVIHASPPCQAYTIIRSLRKRTHPDLVAMVRAELKQIGKPYVIENVAGAPLCAPLMLCGTMFPELKVYRHRYFECFPSCSALGPATCNHSEKMGASKGAYHRLDRDAVITCVGHNFQAESGRVAMQIDWMTRDELSQAIPPAYTEFIGRQIL